MTTFVYKGQNIPKYYHSLTVLSASQAPFNYQFQTLCDLITQPKTIIMQVAIVLAALVAVASAGVLAPAPLLASPIHTVAVAQPVVRTVAVAQPVVRTVHVAQPVAVAQPIVRTVGIAHHAPVVAAVPHTTIIG